MSTPERPAALDCDNRIGTALRLGAGAIGGESPRLDAELLLSALLTCSRADIFRVSAEPLDSGTAARFFELVDRRRQGFPIAYLTGHREFWSLDLSVTPDTLVPRPETELLVQTALEQMGMGSATTRVADLGTGSGAVAIALGHERPEACLIATDVSQAALGIAQRNAERLCVTNVEFRQGHWYRPLGGNRFHLIVSNPPYVARDDSCLSRGDLRHEPPLALVGGIDGLACIREIAELSGTRRVSHPRARLGSGRRCSGRTVAPRIHDGDNAPGSGRQGSRHLRAMAAMTDSRIRVVPLKTAAPPETIESLARETGIHAVRCLSPRRLQIDYDLVGTEWAQLLNIFDVCQLARRDSIADRLLDVFRAYCDSLAREALGVDDRWESAVRRIYVDRQQRRKHGRRDERAQHWRKYHERPEKPA